VGAIDWLDAVPVTRSIRQIYYELGRALCQAGRPAEAIAPLERALEEDSDTPDRTLILFELAWSCELAGNRERAFRLYLEAAEHSPQNLSAVLARAHGLLEPAVALAQGRWVASAWAESIGAAELAPAARAQVAVLLARVHLYLAEYDLSLAQLRTAMDLDPAEARNVASAFLNPDKLPPALKELKDGNAHFGLARLLAVVGRSEDALRHVDEALQVGLTGTGYPEAPAQQLKAELLQRMGGRDYEAGAWYFEAGRRFGWRNEHELARELLERANRLRPDHVPTYWYWMEALRMLSYTRKPPYVAPDKVADSLKVWELGIALAPPEEGYSWAYISRALINEQRARMAGGDAWELGWEAIGYLECALLLSPRDVYALSYLGRFYRYVAAEQNALEVTRLAISIEPESTVALEERAAILANLGMLAESEELIERRRRIEPNAWADAVQAYILLNTERHAPALELLKTALADDPENVWYHEMKAFAHSRLGEDAQANAELQWIWERYDSTDWSNQSTYGWAAYKLGAYLEAISIFARLTSDPTESLGRPQRYLGLCYLGAGSVAAGTDHIRKGIALATDAWRLEYFDKVELTDLEKACESWPHGPQVRQVIGELRLAIAAKSAELARQKRSAESELSEILQRLGGEESKPEAVLGATASLARLFAAAGKWLESARLYEVLLAGKERFREARRGLEKAVEGLQRRASNLLDSGQPQRAIEEGFGRALELVRTSAPSKRREAELLAQIGYCRFTLKEAARARAAFAEALAVDLSSEPDKPDPGTIVAFACRALLRDLSAYWDLAASWRSIMEDAASTCGLQQAARSAYRDLTGYLEDWFGLAAATAASSSWLPAVNRLAVEIEAAAVAGHTAQDSPLFQQHLPEMRRRVLQSTGVPVPSVRLRENPSDPIPGRYVVMVDEIPMALGELRKDSRYSPVDPAVIEGLGVPGAALVRAPHPLTGAPGCWVQRAYWDQVYATGTELWGDPLVYLAYHVESVARASLPDFLGFQEVEGLIQSWAREPGGEDLVSATLAEETARLRFSRLLRELVQEHISIAAWRDLLAAVREYGLDKLADLHATVRRRLKPHLPGNGPGYKRIRLPEPVEQLAMAGIHIDGDKTFFALPTDATQNLLAEIRSVVGDHTPAALIARSPRVRAFLRRLTQSEFPALVVLAEDEVAELGPQAAGAAN